MSTQVRFYHLLSTPLGKALPKLMEAAYQNGVKTLIHGREDQIEAMDRAIWTFHPGKFVPHGTQRDPYPDEQPIFLSTNLSPLNGATLLVMINGALYEGAHTFERLFDIFDGSDEDSVTAARERWAAYKSRGWVMEYFRQNDDGSWSQT
ncbi:MAG: DNA polymerase III subunit chi [Rickettsiales bacterium]|nr:DNA polymerase III subunit chi [Rickettsiales bacterium]